METPTSKLRPLLLLVATLLAGFFAYLSFESQNVTPQKQEPATDTEPTVTDDSHTNPVPNSTIETRKNEPEGGEASIEDEAILVFASESDMQNFLNATSGQDLTILSHNATLLSVRVRTRNRSAIAVPNAQVDLNYTLLTPLPIVVPEGDLGPPFENSALDFMRAPSNNAQSGQGLTIAILDTGIRPHSTLDGVNLQHFELGGETSPQDYASHGTAVASLIAGQNGNGIAPAADLISIRVLDTEGIGDTFSLAEGIVRAVDAGADIINMSLGSYGSNQALANAVDYATREGVVLVASAGNESVATLPFPAAFESVIAVGAINANGHPSYFSNQSDKVDIAAPGVGVYAAWDDENWISFTGTSASAPYVSGAIAALSSQLDISASEASHILLENANDTGLPGFDSQTGRGYIDLQRSFDSNTAYKDLALADIYLDPTPSEHGQHTVHITAQNRGTETLNASYIDYTLPNNLTQTIYLGPLEPGQSASHSLEFHPVDLTKPDGIRVKAKAHSPQEGSSDRRDNNERTTTIQLRLPED